MTTEKALAPLFDAPLVTVEEAGQQWQDYQGLEKTILTEEDYLWVVEYTAVGNDGKRRQKKQGYDTRAKAIAAQSKIPGSQLKRRKRKSASRKLAKFFGYQIPVIGLGQVETRQEGSYLVTIERGENYCCMEWLDQDLKTVKATATVFIRSPRSDRTWMGRGGAHRSEGLGGEMAVGQTAFTRAVSHAILDATGLGDERAEEIEDTPSMGEPQEREVPIPEAQPDPRHEDKRLVYWQEAQACVDQSLATPHQVCTWLKVHEKVSITEADLAQGFSPQKVPTEALERLYQALQNYRNKGPGR